MNSTFAPASIALRLLADISESISEEAREGAERRAGRAAAAALTPSEGEP